MPRSLKSKSALHFLLKGLVPYTRENLKLSFHPHQFFNELERISGYSHKTFQNMVWRAEKEGLIRREGLLLKLTKKGEHKLKPFTATKLVGDVRLMIIFDIPESEAAKRRRLRLLLREWRFTPVQKSVWTSAFDYRSMLTEAVAELELTDCAQVFECAKLYPKE